MSKDSPKKPPQEPPKTLPKAAPPSPDYIKREKEKDPNVEKRSR